MEIEGWRECLTNAIRYWEPRRVLYNLVLAVIVSVHYAQGLPFSRTVLQFNLFLLLFALAVLANVAYCAAYIPDLRANIEPPRYLATIPVGVVLYRISPRSRAHSLLFTFNV